MFRWGFMLCWIIFTSFLPHSLTYHSVYPTLQRQTTKGNTSLPWINTMDFTGFEHCCEHLLHNSARYIVDLCSGVALQNVALNIFASHSVKVCISWPLPLHLWALLFRICLLWFPQLSVRAILHPCGPPSQHQFNPLFITGSHLSLSFPSLLFLALLISPPLVTCRNESVFKHNGALQGGGASV